MTVILNGKETVVPEGSTVASLIRERGIDPETVVVELNRDIIPSDRFGTVTLAEGDTVEVLRFVGGG